MDSAKAFQDLFDAVQRRPRPEDVAELVMKVLGNDLHPSERKILEPAARGSLHRSAWGYSSMAADFFRPVGAKKQVEKAAEIFKVTDYVPSPAACMDPAVVQNFLTQIQDQIVRKMGDTNFLKDRKNREERRKAGLQMNHRAYNKRWRMLKRMENKIQRMIRNAFKYDMSRMSKSALATKLTFEEFSKDLNTACFIAYLTARMNVRSVFTDKSQERAFDNIAKMLFDRARQTPTVNWMAIAYVHPEKDVLAKLTDDEKGRLLGMATNILSEIAVFLEDLAEKTNIRYDTLIVQRGNDSTTWNQSAGAWNKAREAWLNLLFALGMHEVLDVFCPGKVMRLMAADVVRWHSYSKGSLDDSLHPDTKVWRDLPKPWEVLQGKAECSRALVEATCDKYSVGRGSWAQPRPDKKAVAFKPTPELVHGVAITNPFLAASIRKLGWFSGKGVRGEMLETAILAGEIAVQTDEHGFITGVGKAPEATT